MSAKIFCCCNEAFKFCADTCNRWTGVSKPEIVYNIPAWSKRLKAKNSAHEHTDSLDCPEPK